MPEQRFTLFEGLIVGYIIRENGLALAFIKALGYNIDEQAQNFLNDLKQGHYAKLPPKSSLSSTNIVSICCLIY